MTCESGKSCKLVSLGDPVLAARSAPNETRWGFHQFPSLNRLPDGGISLSYANADDSHATHGSASPALVSHDQGRSWQPMTGDLKPVTPHFAIAELCDGDYLAIPGCRYFDITKESVTLPEPFEKSGMNGSVCFFHRYADCPPKVQAYFRHVEGRRWSARTKRWEDCQVEYDTDQLVVWRSEHGNLLPRTALEHAPVKCGGELLYADYRIKYTVANDPDILTLRRRRNFTNIVPRGGAAWLMASSDNGRSFKRRACVAVDINDRGNFYEPHLAPTSDGGLVCVMRQESGAPNQPMAITWSDDAGHTWEPPQDLLEFGVFPNVLLLGNGVMVLSYGRPGVHLAFDSTGTGRRWTGRLTLIEGDPRYEDRLIYSHSCGYTSLLALDDDSFLIAYSDFQYSGSDGQPHKAILTRRVQVAGYPRPVA